MKIDYDKIEKVISAIVLVAIVALASMAVIYGVPSLLKKSTTNPGFAPTSDYDIPGYNYTTSSVSVANPSNLTIPSGYCPIRNTLITRTSSTLLARSKTLDP